RDGRYVAFSSYASNLVPDDRNANSDVFLRDRSTGTTTRLSITNEGTEASGRSVQPSMSADARYVGFQSSASNLVSGDDNNHDDIFLYDRVAAVARRVSISSTGMQSNGVSFAPRLSPDGRYVGFISTATNLVPNDANGVPDVFLHDRL